ncbi:MAG: ankyrin repeat domain-containing protein [Endozoicomonadaceae bacterium]|nr:ankyrin repeat domain-containing protein [Endozoicomonadaceae bacterium]
MDYEICELLINKGADVNAVSVDVNDTTLTTLHVICANNNENNDILNKLLECGADVNARTSDSVSLTALHCAAVVNNSDMAKILLQYGANPNMKTFVNSSDEDEQKTALELAFCASSVDLYDILLPITDRVHLNKLMVQLVCNNNAKGVEKLLEFGLGPDDDSYSSDNINLLHMASNTGSNDVVDTLIKFNANVNIHSVFQEGVTPLHRACFMGHLDVVKTLIEAGHATVDVFDDNGVSPLHGACFKGYIDIVNTLIVSNASVNITSPIIRNKGLTPLHFACSEGHFEVVKTLLEHGSSPNIPTNKTKETPVYPACVKGYSEIVKILVHHGADMTLKNTLGLTAVQCSKDKKVKVKIEAIIQDFLSSKTNQKPREIPDQVDIRNRIAEHPKEAVGLEEKANQQPPLAAPSKSCIFKPFDT